MSDFSTNRREHRVYSRDGDELYRVFRDFDNKNIRVILHKRDFNASDIIVEICGRGPHNYVYETRGNEIDNFPTTGSYAWSNKRVLEFMEETINDRISGRYF